MRFVDYGAFFLHSDEEFKSVLLFGGDGNEHPVSALVGIAQGVDVQEG